VFYIVSLQRRIITLPSLYITRNKMELNCYIKNFF